MNQSLVNLIFGSLLHDVGKIIYRTGESKKHSRLGAEFLSKIGAFTNHDDILDCLRYHHGRELARASVPDDSLAYITYVADNISAASDRRQEVIEGEEDTEGFASFVKTSPLSSVFNVLNGRNDDYSYEFKMINKLSFATRQENYCSAANYISVKNKIKEQLKSIDVSGEYINSVLHLLEVTTSFIPSSTNTKELMDISFFDHSKITAAIASCLYYYLGEGNYKEKLFKDEKRFKEEEAFILYSCDISGIQKYIYTISGTEALKALRVRSLYLELLLENIVDELLERLKLSRCNLIYTGGGHAYLLLPNTQDVKSLLKDFDEELKTWFLKEFDISLFIASGYSECSSNELAYDIGKVYERVGRSVAINKSKRYTADDLIWLNSKRRAKEERECKECKKTGKTNQDERCETCQSLIDISPKLIKDDMFFVIRDLKNTSEKTYLPLPFGQILTVKGIEEARELENIRIYSKNQPSMGYGFSTNIWVGDYTPKTYEDGKARQRAKTFEEYAKESKGIDRIAVLRADVDDLGKAFVFGFKEQKDGILVKNSKRKYETISRTATLSRQLSLFFKFYINEILKTKNRNALIVYSGGDDMFIVGSWNEVLDLANDLRAAFIKYTQSALTISAGIGIFNHSFPISQIAIEVGELENASKTKSDSSGVNTKNKVCLFTKGHKGNDGRISQEWILDWEQLPSIAGVSLAEDNANSIQHKLQILRAVFNKSDNNGKAFLYKILELLRESDKKINIARYAYLLSRAKDKNKNLDVPMFYKWIQSNEEIKEFEIAITLYSYETRKNERR